MAEAAPTDGRKARWVVHRDNRRTLLSNAATGAAAEKGIRVTMEDIARHAGVTRTILYRYFDNVDDALAAAGLRRAVVPIEPLR